MKTSNKSQAEIDARTPDAFLTLSDKLLQWIEKNALLLGILVTAALVVGLGALAFDQYEGWTERKAAGRIYEAESALNQFINTDGLLFKGVVNIYLIYIISLINTFRPYRKLFILLVLQI